MIAKEKGVQPLADAIFAQRRGDDPLRLAQAYVSEEKGVPDAQTAVQLAQDILAEQISDDAAIRASLRALYRRTGMLRAVAAKEGESVYAQYADYREPVLRAAGHRILAINRGEREEWLKVTVECDDEQALQIICRAVIEPGSACCDVVRAAAKDAWGRLISPSLEREIRNELTDKANEGAIRVFGDNLHQLLMQPPVKGFVTMGLDPGYSHGCKVAVVDETGKVLDTTVVYPTFGEKQKQDAITKLSQLIKKDNVRHLAIGIHNIRLALDCDVVLGGFMAKFLEPYLPQLRDQLAQLDPFDAAGAYLHLSRYPKHAALIGAALYFVKQFLDQV